VSLGLCGHPLRAGELYCSRSCAMKALRGRETPTERTQRALKARQAQGADMRERLLARVKVGADSLDARIVLAYRYGLGASKQRNCRKRRERKRMSVCNGNSAGGNATGERL
jgi:hypothetical protein